MCPSLPGFSGLRCSLTCTITMTRSMSKCVFFKSKKVKNHRLIFVGVWVWGLGLLGWAGSFYFFPLWSSHSFCGKQCSEQMVRVSLRLTPRACDLVTNKRELLFLDDIFHLDILLILFLFPLAITMRMWPYQDSQGPSDLSHGMRPKGKAESRASCRKTTGAFVACSSMSRVGVSHLLQLPPFRTA